MRKLRDRLVRAGLGGLERVTTRAERLGSDAARTARFLHGRARFRPRETDVFVASYPRSGTTWTLAILQLIASGARAFDFEHLSDVAPWWERSLAYRADAPERLEALEGGRVFKTHLPRAWLPAGARCVYACRDPGDVALSYFQLYRRYLGFDGDFDAFFERFLRGELQYRSWFRHRAGWERHRADPKVLWVPYEALRRSPAEWVGRMAAFVERPVDRARAEEIAALTDFGAMKAAEAKFDHLGELVRQLGVREGAFIREGRVGAAGQRLSAEQKAALERASAEDVRWPALEWRLPDFLH